MKTSNPLIMRGMDIGTQLGGDSFLNTVHELSNIDPALGDYLAGYAYGQVMAREVVPLADRELAIIAALGVLSHTPQLKWHINAALNIGVDAAAIRETLIQTIPFAGWPVGINALGAFKEVAAERGIALEPEKEAPRSPPADRATLRERGLAHGSQVYADYGAIEEQLRAFDAELPGYLTENSFGQIYPRPGLDMKRRELVAVAILTVLSRLPQLAGHIEGAHRVGCTREETREIIILMHLYAGWPVTINGLGVWKNVNSIR